MKQGGSATGNGPLGALLFTLIWAANAVLIPGTTPRPICELSICSCNQQKLKCGCDQRIQNLALRSDGYDHLPSSLGSITIENCSKVVVSLRAIHRQEALRSVTLKNIQSIELENEAFSWNTTHVLESYLYPGIDIKLINSKIPLIPTDAFRGHLNWVSFEDCQIGTIRELAFSNIAGMEVLEFTRTSVELIEPQAFKKFIADVVIISGGSWTVFPSHSFIGLTINKELRIDGVRVGRMNSLAFRVEGPRVFRVQKCSFGSFASEAFRVTMQGPVFIDDNVLNDVAQGAFAGITVDERFFRLVGPQEFIFENNTLIDFAEGALRFNNYGFEPKIDRVVIEKPCSCESSYVWTKRLIEFTEEVKPVPSDLAATVIWCRSGKGHKTVLSDFLMKNCSTSKAQIYWILSILLLVITFLIALGTVSYLLFRRHRRRYKNVPTNVSAINNRLSTHSQHIIVIPEGKTYKETELHILEERVEPIKDYESPDG